MKERVKIGVVCLTRNTFDFEAAGELYENIKRDLDKIENAEFVKIAKPIESVEQSIEVGKRFSAESLDGVVIISGTFHLGHLALEIKKLCDKPLLLWALPELPYNGGKIRLNSICGVNLNASNLYKSGKTDFVYHVGDKIDENFIDALRISAALKNSRIGLIGSHAQGFFNVDVDKLSLYGKFGVVADDYSLTDLWNAEYKKEYYERYYKMIGDRFEKGLDEERREKVATLAAKMRSFTEDNNLTALAIRCWPEFAKGFGVAPCGAMSLVQSDGVVLACEGDLDCAITMLAHKAIGAETPFMADLSQADFEHNTALMWHCGVAPCNLSDGVCKMTMDTYHAGGRGVTAGFVLKSGKINASRFDSVGGKYRLFCEDGEALPMDKVLSGTYAKVTFALPMKELLDKVVYSGLAHHVSMVYGDFSAPMKTFAKLNGIEVI